MHITPEGKKYLCKRIFFLLLQLSGVRLIFSLPNESLGKVVTFSELVDRNYFFNTQPEVQIPLVEDEVNCKFSESMKILQQHGITMLPADDSNILSSILESGRSVSLTGKFNYLVVSFLREVS